MGIMGWFRNRSQQKALDELQPFYLQAVNVIKMAVAIKLLAEYRKAQDEDRALTLAAAVSNVLLASPSPDSPTEVIQTAKRLAEDALRRDDEIRYAAVMGCRAYLLCNFGADSERQWLIWDTLQWMATVCSLPPDEAGPTLIRNLANGLHDRYMQKT